MSIFIFGSRVTTKLPASSLTEAEKIKELIIDEKEVELTIGYDAHEKAMGNCGVFLYWRGRLIEGYKRVGFQKYNTDKGLGVIGVAEVGNVLGSSEVLNNKQGFVLDSEAYSVLETWLTNKVNQYCDQKLNNIDLHDGEILPGTTWVQQAEWVQCDKCQKWRTLPVGYDQDTLPSEWFCYMEPFKRSCSVPEEDTNDLTTFAVHRAPMVTSVPGAAVNLTATPSRPGSGLPASQLTSDGTWQELKRTMEVRDSGPRPQDKGKDKSHPAAGGASGASDVEGGWQMKRAKPEPQA